MARCELRACCDPLADEFGLPTESGLAQAASFHHIVCSVETMKLHEKKTVVGSPALTRKSPSPQHSLDAPEYRQGCVC